MHDPACPFGSTTAVYNCALDKTPIHPNLSALAVDLDYFLITAQDNVMTLFATSYRPVHWQNITGITGTMSSGSRTESRKVL